MVNQHAYLIGHTIKTRELVIILEIGPELEGHQRIGEVKKTKERFQKVGILQSLIGAQGQKVDINQSLIKDQGQKADIGQRTIRV